MKRINCTRVVLFAVMVIFAYGCTSPKRTEPPALTDGQAKKTHAEHADHNANGSSDMEKIKAALAELSLEDRVSAEKQHVCPVSGEMLGTMGAPQKIDVKGQQVWICCDGCKDELLADPDKYLAQLKK